MATGSARAAGSDAEARFAEARAAFEAADFSRALGLFEQCLALGMQGPAIHYNIGVAAYRSHDLERAERAFHEVARTPAMAPLAYYNLGLIALERRDPAAARGWFERVGRDSTDERLIKLASRQLEALPQAPPPRTWSAYARAGLGYDDNVALRSASIDTAGTGLDDSFMELLASGSYSFLPAWRVDGAAGTLRYSSLDAFNQVAGSLGVTRELSLDAWYLELSGYLGQLSLGGDVYERDGTAAAQVWRSFPGYGTLRGQLRLSTVDGEGDFSGLSGSRTELGASYDWSWRKLGFAAHTRAEFNDSEDELFASRWLEFGAEARWSASALWSFNASARLRRTNHPASSDTQDAWEDRRASLRLEATRTLWKQTQIYVRYEHERNQSALDSHDYSRNWVAASIEYWR